MRTQLNITPVIRRCYDTLHQSETDAKHDVPRQIPISATSPTKLSTTKRVPKGDLELPISSYQRKQNYCTSYFDNCCQIANHHSHVLRFGVRAQDGGVSQERAHVIIASYAEHVNSS